MAQIHLEEDCRGKCLHVHTYVGLKTLLIVIGDNDQNE